MADGKSIEDEIYDNLMEAESTSLTDDVYDDTENESAPVEGVSSSVPTEKPTTESEAEAGKPVQEAANKAAEGPKPESTPQPQVQGSQKKAIRDDGKGNLVDQNGNIIARAGTERRLYQKAERLDRIVKDQQRDIDHAVGVIQQYKQLLAEPQRLGLTPSDLQDTYRIAGLMKQNPVNAAKAVLAMVLAQGYNLDQILGSDGGAALNTEAITKAIDQRIAPIVDAQRQQEEAAYIHQQAQSFVNRFFAENEGADVHEELIVETMREIGRPNEEPYVTAKRAWGIIQKYITDNNLNPDIPIRAQLAARERQQPVQQPQQSPPQMQPPARPVAPIPQGRAAQSIQQQAQPMKRASDSWDDIIRDAMRR